MRLDSKESLWAIARLWYGFFGLIALAMFVTACQNRHGFRNLFEMFRGTRPVGWLVIAAILAPGPIAHGCSRRVKE